MTASQETRKLARDLYVTRGLTFKEVAAQTGVNEATVKRWAKEDEPSWNARREEFRRDEQGLAGDLIELRNGMLRKALDNLDPQYAYAVVAIEKLLGTQPGKPGKPGDDEHEKPKSKEELLKMIREEIYGLS